MDSEDTSESPVDFDGLLAAFKDKLDAATINAVVEEFHGDIETAFQVLKQLAEARDWLTD